MIPEFEEYTADLNELEIKELVPVVASALRRKVGKNNAITNAEMCRRLRTFHLTWKFNVKGPKMRKIVQYIRVRGLVPRLASTSRGYYVCNDDVEFGLYLDGLKGRITSMQLTYDALDHQLRNPKLYDNA